MHAKAWAAASVVLLAAAGLLAWWSTTGLAAEPVSGDAPGHSAEHVETFEQVVEPFLGEYCIDCHGPDRQRGDLRLDTLGSDMTRPHAAEQWAEALRMLSHREMPPEKRPQPEDEEAAAVVDWLAAGLQEASELQQQTGGRMILRRLNRREYRNTIRDLMGVDFDAAGLLPPDTRSHGFDTVGAALTVSTLHIERYAEAAREIVDRAIVTGDQPEAVRYRAYPAEGGNQSLPNRNADDGEPARRGVVRTGVPNDEYVRDGLAYLQPYQWQQAGLYSGAEVEPGEYIVRIHAGAVIPTAEDVKEWAREHIEDEQERAKFIAHVDEVTWYDFGPPRLRLSNQRKAVISEFDVDAPVDNRQTYEVRVPWGMIMTTELVRIANNYHVPQRISNHRYRGLDGFPRPELAVEWFEIEGPVYDSWPPASHQAIFFDSPERETDERAYARQVLERFMRRAYRRPVETGEVDAMLALYEEQREHSDSLEEAMKTPLIAVLCSPHFLYMIEPRPEQDQSPRRLTDHEIATRLSYFLWSSMPDDELFALAEEGRLEEEAVLRQQVERMLADDRAEAFVEAFAEHWLELRRVGEVAPDESLYPEYDDHLQESMRKEGAAFFAEVLHEDRSVLNFLTSDFAVVNERLARFYGIPDVRGDAFRAVNIGDEVARGGVLTMAGVHTITSNGTRTSPVLRGVWVLENILNDPPPPPPPDVGEIPPEAPGVDEATVRERLQAHRQVAQCASCHAKIDPLGFAMENYDAIGKFRQREGMGYNGAVRDNDPAVDASGELPDGRSFENLAELQQILMDERDAFVAGFVEKMLIYALGRNTDIGDRETLEHLAEHVESNGYRMRALLSEIVVSEPFLTK